MLQTTESDLNNIQLRIEIQIFSIKTVGFLISVKPFGLLGDIKIANVFHHLAQAKYPNFNSYIYI